MFLLMNSFLLFFSLICGSCYNIKPEDDPFPMTTIHTKVNFLHESIKLPAGVPEEDLNKIKETLNTYDKIFMEIEKGSAYCKFDKQINNCTAKMEDLKQNLLNEIQMLQRQKRERPQFWLEPNFSKCFPCMSLFANRVRNVLDNYVVHFVLVFNIDKGTNPEAHEDGGGQGSPQNPNGNNPQNNDPLKPSPQITNGNNPQNNTLNPSPQNPPDDEKPENDKPENDKPDNEKPE